MEESKFYNSLTKTEKAFVDSYVQLNNASQACRIVFPKVKNSRDKGYRLLQKNKIKMAVKERQTMEKELRAIESKESAIIELHTGYKRCLDKGDERTALRYYKEMCEMSGFYEIIQKDPNKGQGTISDNVDLIMGNFVLKKST